MTLEQLKYFCAVASLLHMTRAAQQEQVSQPSLSIAIRKLEQELQVPLFYRSGKSLALTEAGQKLLPYARSILQQAEQAKRQMAEQSGQFHSRVSLAYTASVACRYIPELLADFQAERKSDCCILSEEMPSSRIVQGLKEGRFDLGIGSVTEPDPDLVQVPVLYQPLVVILSQGETEEEVTPETLCRMPFVSYCQGYPMYEQVQEIFQELGVRPDIRYYAYSEDAIARLVEKRLGMAVVAETESLGMYRLAVQRPGWLQGGRYVYLTYHRYRYRGAVGQELLDFILRRAQEGGT